VTLKGSQWVPLVLPALHLVLCIATRAALFASEGSWGWFVLFVADFPFSIALLPLLKVADPLVVFGTLGTAWWRVLSRFGIYCVHRLGEFTRRSLPPPGL